MLKPELDSGWCGISESLTRKPHVEWKQGPRSYTSTHNGIRLDVWKVSGKGWRFNAFDAATKCYIGYREGLASLDEACDAAIDFAEAFRL